MDDWTDLDSLDGLPPTEEAIIYFSTFGPIDQPPAPAPTPKQGETLLDDVVRHAPFKGQWKTIFHMVIDGLFVMLIVLFAVLTVGWDRWEQEWRSGRRQ